MAGLSLESDADAQLEAETSELPDAEAAVVTPPKKKRGKGSRKSAKKGPNPNKQQSAVKKCNDCKKEKDQSLFYQDQNKCIDCFQNRKALLRVADVQGVKQDVLQLQDSDPPAFAELQRSFNKHRAEMTKETKKIKFSVVFFIREYEKRQGFRDSRVGEFIWEGEWTELAAGAKFGYMTKEEAALEWARMKAEAWRPRDQQGPKGFLRLWVKLRDIGEIYNDLNRSTKFQQQESLKKATEQQIQSRTALVFSDALNESDPLNFEAVTSEAMLASGSGERMSGLMESDLAPLMDAASRKSLSKRPSKSFATKAKLKQEPTSSDEEGPANTEAVDDEEDRDSEAESDGVGKPASKRRKVGAKAKAKPGPKAKNTAAPTSWFDAETKNIKAEKDYLRAVETLQQSMQSLASEMNGAVAEFRACKEDAEAIFPSHCVRGYML